LWGTPEHWRHYFGGTEVSGEVRGLAPLVELTDLRLDNTLVVGDIGALATLAKVMILYLTGTEVSGDVKGLAPLVELTHLRLDNTLVAGDVKG
jgi:hypothetical protein